MRAPLPADEERDAPIDEIDKFRMPLLEHIRELRNRLMWSIAALTVGVGISLAFVDDIIKFITAPVDDTLEAYGIGGGLAIVNSPFEGMNVWFNAALLGGVVIAAPVIAYQVWGFIAPGLYKTEQKLVIPLTIASTGLFGLGAAFTYYVIFPVAFPFFFTVVDADVTLSIEGYLSAVVKMIVAFGLCFQLPVLTFFLGRLGLIDGRDMVKAFRYAIVAIFVVAAIITPPDVLMQMMLSVPLIGLYGISIAVVWFSSTKVRPPAP